MSCVCGGRKPIRILKGEGEWLAEVYHDGWDEVGYFVTWEAALDWAYWRVA